MINCPSENVPDFSGGASMALGGSAGLGSGFLCISLAVGLSRKLKTEYLSLRTFGTPTRVELQQCEIK